MAETTSDPEQLKKTQAASEAPGLSPSKPMPELDGTAPLLSLGPGLGSPDGFDAAHQRCPAAASANRPQRVQTLTAMQRQLGNQQVQRLMVQRQLAEGRHTVQREDIKKDETEDAGTITVDEVGVTNAVYNKAAVQTRTKSSHRTRRPRMSNRRTTSSTSAPRPCVPIPPR